METLKIKLKRVGSSSLKNFSYNIIVIKSKKRIKGKFFEKIGFYSTHSKKKIFFINFDRLSYWLYKKAVLTDRVGFLISKLFLVKSLKFDCDNKMF